MAICQLRWKEVGEDLYEVPSKHGNYLLRVYPTFTAAVTNREFETLEESESYFESLESAAAECAEMLRGLAQNASIGTFAESTPFRQRAEVLGIETFDDSTPKWVIVDKMWVGDIVGVRQQIFADCYDAMLWCELETNDG